jgi:hypothetical protein
VAFIIKSLIQEEPLTCQCLTVQMAGNKATYEGMYLCAVTFHRWQHSQATQTGRIRTVVRDFS